MKKRNVHNELDRILNLLSIGFTKKQIQEKLNLSKSNLSNYLGKLENQGYILRQGKYEVQVIASSLTNPKVTKIPIHKLLNKRGHAFNFKILFPSEENLKKNPLVQQFIIKRHPKILKFGSIQFKYKRNTIWINKNSLTIYSNNSYYSDNALHSKFQAMKEIDLLIRYLKQKFSFKGIYGIEIFREHYGLIFNKFAEWLLERKGKMEVKDKGNKSILWVDDSREDDINLKEFEGVRPLKINKADNYFKSLDNLGWEDPRILRGKLKELSEQNIMLTQLLEQMNNNMIRITKNLSFLNSKKSI